MNRAGKGEATRATVSVGMNTASKDIWSAKKGFCRMRSCTDHMVHRELRGGSDMIGLWFPQL